MELANVSSSVCLYATSPNPCGRKSLTYLYRSVPVSPRGKTQEYKSDFPDSNFVDLEFESSKTFSRRQRYRERGGSLPSVVFGDDFFSGIVMPLKLPPRLQYNSVFNRSSQSLTFASSSKSPTTMCRIPFACKHTWKDDFDPFAVALEKVRGEKRGRTSCQPRRSRSYSPFRITSKYSCTDTVSCNQDSYEDKSLMKSTNQVPVLSYSGPLELKGSAYARWVLDQKKEGLNLRRPKNPTGVLIGQRVRPMKNEHDGIDKPASTEGRDAEDKCGNDNGESRVQKFKGLLLKYASFGREKNVTKLSKKSVQAQKGSYFSRLSFKFRENGKRMLDDERTTVA